MGVGGLIGASIGHMVLNWRWVAAGMGIIAVIDLLIALSGSGSLIASILNGPSYGHRGGGFVVNLITWLLQLVALAASFTLLCRASLGGAPLSRDHFPEGLPRPLIRITVHFVVIVLLGTVLMAVLAGAFAGAFGGHVRGALAWIPIIGALLVPLAVIAVNAFNLALGAVGWEMDYATVFGPRPSQRATTWIAGTILMAGIFIGAMVLWAVFAYLRQPLLMILYLFVAKGLFIATAATFSAAAFDYLTDRWRPEGFPSIQA
ncbi:MAG: hypothetical protein AB7O49_13995 [Sphingomonadales bacterium]